MKRSLLYLLTVLFALSAFSVSPALAQSEGQPAGPTGEVRGTVINRNSGKVVSESLEVMLHVLDRNFSDQGMTHAQSQPDGTFIFADVPFDSNLQFAVMAIYDGATYFSETIPADMDSMQTVIEVPVYESTSDLASIRIDQMHVLFGIAEDGLEVKEIYAFSNIGDRTVRNAYELDGGQAATLEFPLPEDADYVFFKPEDQDRFIRLSGGFADMYPIPPGTGPSQIMVSYLLPYSGKRNYSYTAPINIARIIFLVPDQEMISLKGSGLMEPEPMELQTGESYLVYSYSGLNAGQTVSVSISGRTTELSTGNNTNTLIAIGAAFLGFAVLGVGIWWWRRPDDAGDEIAEQPNTEMDFDQTVNEIAQLDQAHEKGEIDEQEYQHSREVLRMKARALLERTEQDTSTVPAHS